MTALEATYWLQHNLQCKIERTGTPPQTVGSSTRYGIMNIKFTVVDGIPAEVISALGDLTVEPVYMFYDPKNALTVSAGGLMPTETAKDTIANIQASPTAATTELYAGTSGSPFRTPGTPSIPTTWKVVLNGYSIHGYTCSLSVTVNGTSVNSLKLSHFTKNAVIIVYEPVWNEGVVVGISYFLASSLANTGYRTKAYCGFIFNHSSVNYAAIHPVAVTNANSLYYNPGEIIDFPISLKTPDLVLASGSTTWKFYNPNKVKVTCYCQYGTTLQTEEVNAQSNGSITFTIASGTTIHLSCYCADWFGCWSTTSTSTL